MPSVPPYVAAGHGHHRKRWYHNSRTIVQVSMCCLETCIVGLSPYYLSSKTFTGNNPLFSNHVRPAFGTFLVEARCSHLVRTLLTTARADAFSARTRPATASSSSASSLTFSRTGTRSCTPAGRPRSVSSRHYVLSFQGSCRDNRPIPTRLTYSLYFG